MVVIVDGCIEKLKDIGLQLAWNNLVHHLICDVRPKIFQFQRPVDDHNRCRNRKASVLMHQPIFMEPIVQKSSKYVYKEL